MGDVVSDHGRRLRSRRCHTEGDRRRRSDGFEIGWSGSRPATLLTDGGYSIDEPRTDRARSTGFSVEFLTIGPGYRVLDVDGPSHLVDAEAETCDCSDHRRTGVYCAHLRRVDLAIRTGELPRPDGRYVR